MAMAFFREERSLREKQTSSTIYSFPSRSSSILVFSITNICTIIIIIALSIVVDDADDDNNTMIFRCIGIIVMTMVIITIDGVNMIETPYLLRQLTSTIIYTQQSRCVLQQLISENKNVGELMAR